MQTPPNRSRSIVTDSAAMLCALLVASAHADTFGTGPNAFTIDFVNVGNPGNADDAGAGGGLYSSPYGGVSYVYRMAMTEVPQDWITKATNLGMTNVTAGGSTGLKPATLMSWHEAAAFVNWLNDQRAPGLKAYDLAWTGTAWTMNLWSSAQAWQMNGENLYRHKDAYYFLPSEDEWYKAAYHKNDGVTANYWDYATGSNTIPTAMASGTAAGTAVYLAPAGPANVDNSGGLSPYGTRGQNGNVWEWQESALTAPNDSSSELRAVRGGDSGNSGIFMRSSFRDSNDPNNAFVTVGFRVASVPEPSCMVLMIGSGLMWLARRRRASSL